ncbi:LPS export ABC transporter periplasmic protein LptC [Robertkochia aurantiaca]|uniref:LPS export ABC transporter periplasmic protein LptC n=1 Tax=Robertkochia aurantiaca TaxID=2873700 RepID=UPI001CCB136F|nr:LPS export ABC transporter periplasmic protein LptC [Robertkochia sp. 3YJGBD-33]
MNIVTVCAVTMFFSCRGDISEVQEINRIDKIPNGVAENFRLKYTDSTHLKAVVSGPLYKDFGNQSFPYQEFPEGVYVEYYGDNDQVSTIQADYGIVYSGTDLIDLQGNVVIKTHDGKILRAPQLYWDQTNDWIFTEERFTFESDEYDIEGVGIDFNKEYTQLRFRQGKGDAVIEE